jgi:predicted RNA-binding protein YlqC (UPF0109 family)
MEELVRAIAKSLVENPGAVDVRTVADGGETVIELRVDSADMGRVIGRQGRIAKAIRVVVKAVAARENKRVTIEIIQ